MAKNKLVDSNKTRGPSLIGSHEMLSNYTLTSKRKMLTNLRGALKSAGLPGLLLGGKPKWPLFTTIL